MRRIRAIPPGIDALPALTQLFNTAAVASKRLPAGSHVQGNITDGGSATNVVPAYAERRFGLRAWSEGVAATTSTTVDVTRQGSGYSHFRDNDVLSDRFSEHIAGSCVHLVRPGDGEHRSLHRQRAATGGEEGVISADGLQCKAAQAANRELPVH
ncbi:hypothetical protein [Streptomyces xanthophaeus]|uniref:Peptidase M20 dimerisation domain-containing protein n=1 Tax=Streptomyces xanthophaeus TaxID=67385 RepID=A0A919GSG4_9ACTN|nr:hypothetical protein [Streptomyces xanthophaeus]GHI82975.1 hypothetical protein Sxan_03390 [Streptomyces xanthophaeus]